MADQKRLLEIESCNRCKYLDIANSGMCDYYVCRKDNRVIETVEGCRTDYIMRDIPIPVWCSLPMSNDEA